MMKKKRCMADGGVLMAEAQQKETPEQMLARMNARYGLGGAGISPAAPHADRPRVEQQQPAQPQRPAPTVREGLTDVIGRRNEELKKAAGYASGGIMPVVGAGTGTSDSIPVVVAGQDIRLSNGEGAAILPAETMKNKAAVRAVEGIIEATNGKPTARNDDEDREGMACGGIAGKRKMAGGGVIDPEEEKRQQAAPTAQEVYAPAYRAVSDAANSVTTPTAQTAPTAQEVYRNVSASGMADAVTPKVGLSDHPIYGGVSASGAADALRNWSSTATPTAAPASAPPVSPTAKPMVPAATAVATTPALPAVAPTQQQPVPSVRPWYAGTDTRDDRTGLQQEQARVAAGQGLKDQLRDLNGPSLLTSAVLGEGSGQAATPSQRTGPTSAEADRAIEQQAVGAASPSLAANTGNSGAATTPGGAQQVNMGAGFDPTKLKMADGYGMITDPKTGRTMMVSGAGAQPVAGWPVDAYGNSTAITQQHQRQIDRLQQEKDQRQAEWDKQFAGKPSYEQQRAAEADRFTQFVRQADADRLAHDLGTGGGNARTNAGKIAALDAMRKGIADDLGRKTQVEVAGIQGTNQLAAENVRGRNQLANTGLVGQNQLATTALQGQNALAVEDVRQSGPEKALKAVKAQVEIEDATAQRQARNGILDAIKTGDPKKVSEAWRIGIATGAVKPEPQGSYDVKEGLSGGLTRTNQKTGETERYDEKTKTWERLGGGDATGAVPPPESRKVGQTYQTPRGPMVWRGNGWEPA